MNLSRRHALRVIGGTASTLAMREFLGQGARQQNSTSLQANVKDKIPSLYGFNTYTEDYARFCAKPADQRVFYALEGGQIVKEKLDEHKWLPTRSPAKKNLPIAGGSWDDVPLESPFPDNLSGDGPYKANWNSLMNYDAPEWYRDAKFVIVN